MALAIPTITGQCAKSNVDFAKRLPNVQGQMKYVREELSV
jgi:hypothetical protein